MQLRTKVISAAGIAAVVAAGGFAFTSSSGLPTAAAAGYGNVSVTGLNVTAINYTWTDDTIRDTATAVVFTTAENITDKGNGAADAKVKINDTSYTACTDFAWHALAGQVPAHGTLTCPMPTTPNNEVNNLESISLSYVSSTTP